MCGCKYDTSGCIFVKLPKNIIPKFNIGDIVQYSSENSYEDKNGYRPGSIGIIVAHCTVAGDLIYQFDPEECIPPNGFRIEYFSEKEERNYIKLRTLKFCEGVKNTRLCNKCEYRFKCWTTRRK